MPVLLAPPGPWLCEATVVRAIVVGGGCAVTSVAVSWWRMPGTLLPMFPLSEVLFPHSFMPLHVFEPRYRDLLRDCLAGDARFGIVLIARGSEVGGGDQRSTLGTRGIITQAVELPDGRWFLEIKGETVITVEEWLPDDPYPQAVVTDLPDRSCACRADVLAGAEGSLRRVRSLLSELGDVPALPHRLRISGDAEEVGWQLCDMAPLVSLDLQRLLAAVDVESRMRLLVELCDAMAGDVVGLLSGGGAG